MAKELLITETLTEEMKTAGAKLIKRLDEDNGQVISAFWLFSEEDRLWKLIIASELVISDGPISYYRRISTLNEQTKNTDQVISLHDIRVVGPDQKIVQLLPRVTATANGGSIAGTRNAINGVFIDDVYIYRTSRQPKNVPSFA